MNAAAGTGKISSIAASGLCGGIVGSGSAPCYNGAGDDSNAWNCSGYSGAADNISGDCTISVSTNGGYYCSTNIWVSCNTSSTETQIGVPSDPNQQETLNGLSTGDDCPNLSSMAYGVYSNTALRVNKSSVKVICAKGINSASRPIEIRNITNSAWVTQNGSSGNGYAYKISRLATGNYQFRAFLRPESSLDYCRGEDPTPSKLRITCETSVTTMGVSTSSPDCTSSSTTVTQGQTTVFAKACNHSLGYETSMSESPNGWSQSSIPDNTAVSIPISGMAAGTHTVTATTNVGAGGCAVPPVTAMFNCPTAPPSGFSLDNPVGTIQTPPTAPNSFQWKVDWGMDRCGGDNPSDDSATGDLYSGGCGANDIGDLTNCQINGQNVVCTLSSFTGTWVPGQTYYWRIRANNGALAALSSCQTFVFRSTALPWWQVEDGHVYGSGSVSSFVPQYCFGTHCYLSLKGIGGFPGVPTGGTLDFNGKISETSWQSQGTVYQGKLPSISTFIAQAPVIPADFSDPNQFGSLVSGSIPSGSDAIYLNYTSTTQDLLIDSLSFPSGVIDRKVVVFSTGGRKVVIDRNIFLLGASSFFGLLSNSDTEVGPTVTTLVGLYFSETGITTLSAGAGTDPSLQVSGMLLSNGTVILRRSVDGFLSNTTPSELVTFDPSLIVNLPRAIRRVQYQLSELAPVKR